jgi:hypothetical protein
MLESFKYSSNKRKFRVIQSTGMTYSSEKFCLKWNDFQENIVNSFQDLRKETEFSDVTLVCEDNHTIEAHRIILTACNPFFSTVLKSNKNFHPMIYMRGLKSKNMVAIVDFIYYGEANIYQEDLDEFLALADELQLKGLAGSASGSQDRTVDMVQEPLKNQTIHKTELDIKTTLSQKTRRKSPESKLLNTIESNSILESFENTC